MLVLVFLHLYHNPDMAVSVLWPERVATSPAKYLHPKQPRGGPYSSTSRALMEKLYHCPDAADCDVLLLRHVFDRLNWVFFAAHFHLEFFGLFFLIIALVFFFCALILVPRCWVEGRHGVPCISSIASASHLCPSGNAATVFALITPTGVPIKCSSDNSMDPIHTPYSTLLLTY